MDNDRLQKIIESCHVNFLIGSGASRNYLDTLWNIENLLTALDQEKERESDQFKILETSIRSWYFEKCIKGNLKFGKYEFLISDELQKEYDITLQNYNQFVSALNLILLKRKTNLLSRQINLFTTNMDLFLDKVLDNLGIEFNDGFSGRFESVFKTSNYQKSVFKASAQYDISSELPLFNLFKLHGSLTWSKVYEDKVIYDQTLTVLNNLKNIDFSEESLVQLTTVDGDITIYKDYEALKSECEELKIVNSKIFETFKTEYEKLVMINPTKEKFENTTLRVEYYEQMRMFSNILEKENSVLFVTGFSFTDEHIRQIVTRSLNSNPTLFVCVFCYNDSEKVKIDNLFPSLKFSNLYTGYTNYDFQKMANGVFANIANSLDSNFYKLNNSSLINEETQIRRDEGSTE